MGFQPHEAFEPTGRWCAGIPSSPRAGGPCHGTMQPGRIGDETGLDRKRHRRGGANGCFDGEAGGGTGASHAREPPLRSARDQNRKEKKALLVCGSFCQELSPTPFQSLSDQINCSPTKVPINLKPSGGINRWDPPSRNDNLRYRSFYSYLTNKTRIVLPRSQMESGNVPTK